MGAFSFGGPYRIRTGDLLHAMEALYQLSQRPSWNYYTNLINSFKPNALFPNPVSSLEFTSDYELYLEREAVKPICLKSGEGSRRLVRGH